MAETGSMHATRFEAAVKVIQSLPKNGECGRAVRRQRRHRSRAGAGGGQGSGTGAAGPARQRLQNRGELGIGAALRLSGKPSEPCQELLSRESGPGDQGICHLPAISASLEFEVA